MPAGGSITSREMNGLVAISAVLLLNRTADISSTFFTLTSRLPFFLFFFFFLHGADKSYALAELLQKHLCHPAVGESQGGGTRP